MFAKKMWNKYLGRFSRLFLLHRAFLFSFKMTFSPDPTDPVFPKKPVAVVHQSQAPPEEPKPRTRLSKILSSVTPPPSASSEKPTPGELPKQPAEKPKPASEEKKQERVSKRTAIGTFERHSYAFGDFFQLWLIHPTKDLLLLIQ